MFNLNVFRSNDIRGEYGKDFDEDFAEELGMAFASFLEKRGNANRDVVVGCDIRSSSESLKEALVKGLTSSGFNVTDIGTVTTPLFYFTVKQQEKGGGIMITGSHLPKEFNGFKLVDSNGSMIGRDTGLEDIKNIINRRDFLEAEERGTVNEYGKALDDYSRFVLGKIGIARRLKVVIDPGNSVGSVVAPKIFETAGCDVVVINGELDSSFPNRPLEPKPENLEKLQEAVKAHGADMGVAYDGDADRVVFVDNEANVIDSSSLVIMMLAEHYLAGAGVRGSAVVFDLGCSMALAETIREMGGTPVETKVGAAYIKDSMSRHNAILGGESSSHLYFADTFNFDDAVFASLKMAEIISKLPEGTNFADKARSLPNYFYFPEWEFECADEKKHKVLQVIKEKFAGSGVKFSELDGLKLHYDDGWVMWRPSGTRPSMKIYVEARSAARLEELKNFARIELAKAVDDVELSKYEEATGGRIDGRTDEKTNEKIMSEKINTGMKAVVLAAGAGTRVMPLSVNKSKVMFRIMGKPLIQYIVENLAAAGFEDVIIVTGQNGEQIRDYLEDGSRFGVRIRYTHQEKPVSTGNAIETADGLVGDRFLVVNGDDVFEPELLRAMADELRRNGAEIVLACQAVEETWKFGIIAQKENGDVKRIVEKPKPGTEPSNLAIVGAYILPKRIFDYIRKTPVRNQQFEDAMQAFINEGGKVRAISYDGFFGSFKYPWDLLAINKYLMDRHMATSRISPSAKISARAIIEGNVFIGDGAKILEGAIVKGPCYIGAGSTIGTNAIVREYSDIGNNCIVGFASEVTRSMLGNGCWLHTNYVGDSILGDNCKFGAGTVTANLRFDEGEVEMRVKDEKMRTGCKKFGIVAAENCRTGINCSLMPGIKMGPNSVVGPGVCLHEDLGPGKMILLDKKSYVIKDSNI